MVPWQMDCMQPMVRELVLDQKRHKAWKFTKKMRRDFADHPPGRIWWVNTNTKVKTSVHDTCIETSQPAPPGLYVFAPLATPETLSKVIEEFQQLYQKERLHHTIPDYNMAPYQNIHVLFTGQDPEDVQMTYREVLEVLERRTPVAAAVIKVLSQEVRNKIGISQECLETHSNLGIIKYSPNSGFVSHIDNLVRSGGTAGPVFTMSLGNSTDGCKHMDMFPVFEHWKSPLRISTPVGSVIMMDGVSRLEWSHGIPSGDNSERWTIMLKFKQISDVKVKFSRILNMSVMASRI